MPTKTEPWLTAGKALHFMQYHVSAVASETRLKVFRNFLPTPELPTFLSRPCRVSQLPAIADRMTLHLQPRTDYSLIEAQVSSSRSPKWITISLTPHYAGYIQLVKGASVPRWVLFLCLEKECSLEPTHHEVTFTVPGSWHLSICSDQFNWFSGRWTKCNNNAQ